MKKENQQKLDDFFKVSFKKHIEHVHPSTEFTDNVMKGLNDTQYTTSKYNQPLFSKKVKWSLGIFLSSLLVITFYHAATSQASSGYQFPPSVINLLNYYSDFFTSGNNLIMMLSAISLGFWSLMLLDKLMQKFTLA